MMITQRIILLRRKVLSNYQNKFYHTLKNYITNWLIVNTYRSPDAEIPSHETMPSITGNKQEKHRIEQTLFFKKRIIALVTFFITAK